MDKGNSSASCANEAALRAAIRDDERRQGRPLTAGDLRAFAEGFLQESRKLAAWKIGR